MSDNTAIPSWADERSFSAHLFALDGAQKIPSAISPGSMPR